MAEAHSERGRRIVAGVDGSVPSKAALAWAVRRARLTGAMVEAITAWEIPATYGSHGSVRKPLGLHGSCHPGHQVSEAEAVHCQCTNRRG